MAWGKENTMENKVYYSASDIAKMLGCSISHAYKLVRIMNKQLAADGYLVLAGKVPIRYFEERWYGLSA